MGKKQSIASFIEKLPMDGSVGDCESALLSTNMGFTGRGINAEDCTNGDKESCIYSVNKAVCVNEGSVCQHAKNDKGCMNTGKVEQPNLRECL